MSDYMLITRSPAGQSPDFSEAKVQSFKRALDTLAPNVELQIEFNLGRGVYVEVFSAPTYDSAERVSRLAQECGIAGELATLRNGW